MQPRYFGVTDAGLGKLLLTSASSPPLHGSSSDGEMGVLKLYLYMYNKQKIANIEERGREAV